MSSVQDLWLKLVPGSFYYGILHALESAKVGAVCGWLFLFSTLVKWIPFGAVCGGLHNWAVWAIDADDV